MPKYSKTRHFRPGLTSVLSLFTSDEGLKASDDRSLANDSPCNHRSRDESLLNENRSRDESLLNENRSRDDFMLDHRSREILLLNHRSSNEYL